MANVSCSKTYWAHVNFSVRANLPLPVFQLYLMTSLPTHSVEFLGIRT